MKSWDRVGLLVLILAVFAVNYSGRVDLRESQLAGCARGKLSNAANAKAWRAAESARKGGPTMLDKRTAGLYAQVADGLEDRSRIDCEREYPAPSLLPKFF